MDVRTKVPILQVHSTSFLNATLTSCPLFFTHFWWATGQSCVRKRSSACKIATLIMYAGALFIVRAQFKNFYGMVTTY